MVSRDSMMLARLHRYHKYVIEIAKRLVYVFLLRSYSPGEKWKLDIPSKTVGGHLAVSLRIL